MKISISSLQEKPFEIAAESLFLAILIDIALFWILVTLGVVTLV